MKCIEDEIPFEVPDGWEWSRLGVIGNWQSGATPSRRHPEYFGGSIPWLKTGDLNDGFIDNVPEHITEEGFNNSSVVLNPVGSVLIAMYGATIGKLGINNIEVTTNQACCACLPILVQNRYLFYYLMAMKDTFISQASGGAQPNISKEKIVSTLFAVPPEEEQVRIIQTIDELMDNVQGISDNKEALLNITSRVKSKILDLAIRGKLVPQDPNDEPASALLNRICDEKEALIKQGKLKRDKKESIIYKCDDNSYYEKLYDGSVKNISNEILYDLPKGWAWCRVQSFIKLTGGAQPPKSTFEYEPTGDNIRLIQIRDYKTDAFVTYIPKTSARRFCSKTDVMIGRYGPPLFQILRGLEGSYNVALMKAETDSRLMSNDYLYYLLQDSELLRTLESVSDRTCGQDGINMFVLNNYLLPIPPLMEQNRIIARVEEILSILNKIEASLS